MENSSFISKLEKIIHPHIRRKMFRFEKKNKQEKFIFFEIPLLIESKLSKKFDIIFFIKAKKKSDLKDLSQRRNKIIFDVLNKRQLVDSKKIKFCDHVIVNEKNLSILKKNLLDIFDKYE